MQTTYFPLLEREFDRTTYILQQQLIQVFPQLKEVLTTDQKTHWHSDKEEEEQIAHPYTDLVKELSNKERSLLILSLIPYIALHKLNSINKAEKVLGGQLSVVGGMRSTTTQAFIPTFQTGLFLLAGTNLEKKLACLSLFHPSSSLFKKGVLERTSDTFDPDAPLRITPAYLQLLLSGEPYQPQYSVAFPASLLETTYEWEDLVLSQKVKAQIEEIKDWIAHEKKIMQEWGFTKHLKKGYRAVFSGKSGTGKTLTATLLGKTAQLPVYRIDISSLVSKYIGETEKNLERLFQMAEHRQWILFFDEAESLFAKRSAVKHANDNYANQTIAYLLQRIEDYNGMIILATNKPTNIDNAFVRRFQSIINFPTPSEEERCLLWQKTFGQTHLTIGEEVNFSQLAKVYTHVTGGILINILRSCAIRVASQQRKMITQDDIMLALKKEYEKHQFMWIAPK